MLRTLIHRLGHNFADGLMYSCHLCDQHRAFLVDCELYCILGHRHTLIMPSVAHYSERRTKPRELGKMRQIVVLTNIQVFFHFSRLRTDFVWETMVSRHYHKFRWMDQMKLVHITYKTNYSIGELYVIFTFALSTSRSLPVDGSEWRRNKANLWKQRIDNTQIWIHLLIIRIYRYSIIHSSESK